MEQSGTYVAAVDGILQKENDNQGQLFWFATLSVQASEEWSFYE